MFLIVLDYQRPPEVMALHVAAHRAHLAEYYAAGQLVLSGPQVPAGAGGVIIARMKTREEVETLMQRDPFVRENLVTYRVIEFVARATHPELAAFAETLSNN